MSFIFFIRLITLIAILFANSEIEIFFPITIFLFITEGFLKLCRKKFIFLFFSIKIFSFASKCSFFCSRHIKFFFLFLISLSFDDI